jgi:phosphoglycerate dehydrogenase-like enzyme
VTVFTVVALGPVDEELVRPILGDDCELVTDPTAAQLSIADGAIVRGNVTVDRDSFDRMPNLRVLARTGVGTERVDLAVATERGIPVVITPGSNTRAVAEGALAMMLSLTKSLPALDAVVREGRWNDRDSVSVGDIDGATVGIVGYGRIGQRLSELLVALGADVIAFDPVATIPDALRCDTLPELLSRAQIVSLHVPLLDSTRHMINAATLALMPAGAVLINCGRGPLIDLDAALVALESGHLGGIGLDVFDDEPPTPHPLFQHPRALLTPHVMGLSHKSAAQTFIDAARGIRLVLDGGNAPATANEV